MAWSKTVVQESPPLVEMHIGPLKATAATRDPSAEQARETQLVCGALERVHVWAGKCHAPEAMKPATTGQKTFLKEHRDLLILDRKATLTLVDV